MCHFDKIFIAVLRKLSVSSIIIKVLSKSFYNTFQLNSIFCIKFVRYRTSLAQFSLYKIERKFISGATETGPSLER